MRKLITILCLSTFGFTFAQEKEIKQETKEERQQRYIEEANPFRKNGYRPRIITLSKGKYREAFPDTIVQVGSFTYNKKSKSIIGFYTTEETQNSEADLRPDLVSRWMSPDPLSEEFPDWSPYNFVENNPIRFNDPEGLSPFDVVIKGDLAEEATAQLNESVEGQLNITRNEDTGKLSYSRVGDGPLTKDAQDLANAIDDQNITVNVEASSSNISSKNGKDIVGGEFQGSTTNFDGLGNAITETYQQVNPNHMDNFDYANNTPGKGTQHEVVESYLGGIEAQNRGLTKVGPATREDAGNPNSVYRVSHDASPVGNNKTIYTDPTNGKNYVKTSWGSKVYIQGKNK